MSASTDLDRLLQQCRHFRPGYAAMADADVSGIHARVRSTARIPVGTVTDDTVLSDLLLDCILEHDGEITAMKACGVGMWQIVTGPMVFAVLLGVGLLTRFAAVSLLVITGVATAAVHWPAQWGSFAQLWEGYVITADGAWRRGSVLALKPQVDEAVEGLAEVGKKYNRLHPPK